MLPPPQAHCSDPVFREGAIAGVIVRPLVKYDDARGWLTELFRHDELAAEFHPAMAYAAVTRPGVTRGPHEHVHQADLFFFFGPAHFCVRLWDNRPQSPTYRHCITLTLGQDNPAALLIPAGVVHAYRNDSECDGLVVNAPNRLFQGPNRTEPADEIRYEDEPDTIFQMDD